jgi:hypothetical protein
MFQWLRKQCQPYTVYDLIEELNPGYGARLGRRFEHTDAMEKQRREEQEARKLEQQRYERERALKDPFWTRRESERKRELLDLQLEDAEWILEYEKRLAELQKKTARQRSRAKQVRADTERLQKLEHHLAGLRRSLD